MAKNKNGIWTRGFVYLFAYEIFTQFAFFLVQPVVSGFAISIGATLAFAGVVAGLSSFISMFCRPVSGLLSDRVDAYKLMCFCTALFCSACLICTVAPSANVLAVGRMLQGVAFALKTTLVVAIVAHVVPSDSLGEGVAYISLAYIVAMALAPLMGTALSEWAGYRVAYFVSTLLLVGALSMALKMKLPESMRRLPSSSGYDCERVAGVKSGCMRDVVRRLKNLEFSDFICVPVLPITLVNASMSFVVGSIVAFVVLAGEEKGVGPVAVYFIAFSAVTMFVRPIAGRMSDRKGPSVVVYPSLICIFVATLLLAWMDSVWMVALAGVFMAFGYGAAGPVLQAECVKRAQNGKVGVATGTYFIGPDLGNCVGPAVTGLLVQMMGYSEAFAIDSFSVLFGAVIYTLFGRVPCRGR